MAGSRARMQWKEARVESREQGLAESKEPDGVGARVEGEEPGGWGQGCEGRDAARELGCSWE